MKRVLIIGGLILVALLIVSGFFFLRQQRMQSAAAEVDAPTIAVTRGSIEEVVSATGNVVADPVVFLAQNHASGFGDDRSGAVVAHAVMVIGRPVVTSVTPYVNIPDYPEMEHVLSELATFPNCILVDAGLIAKAAGNLRAQNMVTVGAASSRLDFTEDQLLTYVEALFKRKGEKIVEVNQRAFRYGRAAGLFFRGLVDGISTWADSRHAPNHRIHGVTLRDSVVPQDGPRVRRLVEITGFFHPEEVDVAEELVVERLKKGAASGYHFVMADHYGRLAGYACFGPIPCTLGSAMGVTAKTAQSSRSR